MKEEVKRQVHDVLYTLPRGGGGGGVGRGLFSVRSYFFSFIHFVLNTIHDRNISLFAPHKQWKTFQEIIKNDIHRPDLQWLGLLCD